MTRWLAASLLALTSLPLAAQVRTLGMPEMVNSAGAIFIGTATDVHGGYDEHGDIVTYTTFNVEQPIHGLAGSTVTVKQLGGQAGGLTTQLAHMRYFTRGERVLVMLYPVSDLGFTSPVGLSQGVWSVSGSQITGVSAAALAGVDLRKYGIAGASGPLDRVKFVAMINDLLKPGKTQMRGGSGR
jgi:hypothetical protein